MNSIKIIQDSGERCEDLEEASIDVFKYVWPGLKESCYKTAKKECEKTEAFPMV